MTKRDRLKGFLLRIFKRRRDRRDRSPSLVIFQDHDDGHLSAYASYQVVEAPCEQKQHEQTSNRSHRSPSTVLETPSTQPSSTSANSSPTESHSYIPQARPAPVLVLPPVLVTRSSFEEQPITPTPIGRSGVTAGASMMEMLLVNTGEVNRISSVPPALANPDLLSPMANAPELAAYMHLGPHTALDRTTGRYPAPAAPAAVDAPTALTGAAAPAAQRTSSHRHRSHDRRGRTSSTPSQTAMPMRHGFNPPGTPHVGDSPAVCSAAAAAISRSRFLELYGVEEADRIDATDA